MSMEVLYHNYLHSTLGPDPNQQSVVISSSSVNEKCLHLLATNIADNDGKCDLFIARNSSHFYCQQLSS